MLIPHDLRKLIDDGLEKVQLDPQHNLKLGHREAIYSFMGPYRFEDNNSNDSGYRGRVNLAVTAVSKVEPIWRKIWPDDDTVKDTIAAAKDLVYKTPREIDRKKLEAETDRLWEYITELIEETEEAAGVVGLAAVKTLDLALWDGYMSDYGIDFERIDNIDFMLNDMHFYAASAYAGGPPYPIALAPRSSSSKRQEFWEWWLRHAVPEAFDGRNKH